MTKRILKVFFGIMVLAPLVNTVYGQDQSSPPNSLVVDDAGNVGVGVDSPNVPLHVLRNPTSATNLSLFLLENKGASRFDIINNNNNINWFFQNDQDGTFKFSKWGTGGAEIIVSERDDAYQNKLTLFVRGSIQATNVSFTSSRSKKEGFETIDTSEVLDKVLKLPITTWQYIDDRNETRHIGPTAEDFAKVIELGGNEAQISVVDANGVALAAIQGLSIELKSLRDENHRLRQDSVVLKQNNEALEVRIAELEKLILGEQVASQ